MMGKIVFRLVPHLNFGKNIPLDTLPNLEWSWRRDLNCGRRDFHKNVIIFNKKGSVCSVRRYDVYEKYCD